MAEIKELTDAAFAEVVADGLVVVNFYGTWCGPCKVFRPDYEDFAEQTDVKVYLADVDKMHKSAAAEAVMSVPTIMFFKDGKVADKLFGGQSVKTLLERVAALKGE